MTTILPQNPPGPARSGPNVDPKYVVIALVVIAALVGGYLAFGRGGGSSPTSTPPIPTSANVTPTTAATPNLTAQPVGVTAADLGTGWQERVISGGDQVVGEVTLDVCGGGYASEALRVARLQVALKNGPTVISSEAVEYASGGAQEAYSELRRRVSNCPKTPVAMPEQGTPPLRFRFARLPVRRSWAARTIAIRITVTARGRSYTSLAIFQFAGNWLSAVYAGDTRSSSRSAVLRAAGIAASKLRSQASIGPAA